MTVSNRFEVLLPQGLEAARGGRDHVAAFLDAQGLGDAKLEALVIASELVTNAVVHGGEPITLEVAIRDDALRVEVRDGDEHAAVVARRREDRGVMTGRGLMIVESLAQQWGVRTRAGGKSVWADIDLSPSEHTGPD
jgi:anti-sigma regulatory factor (Ser/Thr protein kinase)